MTALQAAVYWCLAQLLHVHPQLANFAGYLVAVVSGFVLHGRFTGWWGNFGMSVGSVICFQAVVMAWYGVNFVLGELGNGGLHSYGAGAGGKQYVFGAVALDMLFTAIVVARHATYKSPEDKNNDDDQDAISPNTLTNTDPITEVRGEFLKPSESAGE